MAIFFGDPVQILAIWVQILASERTASPPRLVVVLQYISTPAISISSQFISIYYYQSLFLSKSFVTECSERRTKRIYLIYDSCGGMQCQNDSKNRRLTNDDDLVFPVPTGLITMQLRRHSPPMKIERFSIITVTSPGLVAMQLRRNSCPVEITRFAITTATSLQSEYFMVWRWPPWNILLSLEQSW